MMKMFCIFLFSKLTGFVLIWILLNVLLFLFILIIKPKPNFFENVGIEDYEFYKEYLIRNIKNPYFTLCFCFILFSAPFFQLTQAVISFIFFIYYLIKTLIQIYKKKNTIIHHQRKYFPIFPSFAIILRYIFLDYPQYNALNMRYIILKKYYKKEKNSYNIIYFLIHRCFIWLMGYPIWTIKTCAELSNAIICIKNKKLKAIPESLLFAIDAVIRVKFSQTAILVNQQKIIISENMINFNPNKNISRLYHSRSIVNVRIKETAHAAIGNIDDPTSSILTSKRIGGIKTIPLGRSKSFITINTITNPDNIQEDISRIAHIIENTNLDNSQNLAALNNEIYMHRILRSNLGIRPQEYPNLDSNEETKEEGFYFAQIAHRNNNNNKFKLNNQLYFATQGFADAIENLSKGDLQTVQEAAWIVEKNSPMRATSPFNQTIHITPPQSIKDFSSPSQRTSILQLSESIIQTQEQIIYSIKENSPIQLSETREITAATFSPTKGGWSGIP